MTVAAPTTVPSNPLLDTMEYEELEDEWKNRG